MNHFFILATMVSLLSLAACGDDTAPTDSGTPTDTGTATDSGTGGDSSAPTDSSTPTDSGTAGDSSAPTDSGTDAMAGGACAFNSDCIAAERCECSEEDGCACTPGDRGEGVNGVTECTDGNDCASSVCVEGPDSTTFYCSGECADDDDCTGMLPRCLDIAFVGMICARIPPDE